MWIKLIVFCAFVTAAWSAVARGPLYPKPEKFKDVPGCYIPPLHEVIPVGARAPSNEICMGYRCNSDSITHYFCGLAVAHPPCKLVQDLEKPFPDCCPTIVC